MPACIRVSIATWSLLLRLGSLSNRFGAPLGDPCPGPVSMRPAGDSRALKLARRTLVDQLGIEPGAELVALEGSILRQDDTLLAAPAPPTISEHCPYKGLASYDVDNADTFFGREIEIEACIERLRANPLLLLTGPSGCGKSSLARAGLVPTLIRSAQAVTALRARAPTPRRRWPTALASCDSPPILVVDQLEERVHGRRRRRIEGAVVRRPYSTGWWSSPPAGRAPSRVGARRTRSAACTA